MGADGARPMAASNMGPLMSCAWQPLRFRTFCESPRIASNRCSGRFERCVRFEIHADRCMGTDDQEKDRHGMLAVHRNCCRVRDSRLPLYEFVLANTAGSSCSYAPASPRTPQPLFHCDMAFTAFCRMITKVCEHPSGAMLERL